jgi:hypothetical protein
MPISISGTNNPVPTGPNMPFQKQVTIYSDTSSTCVVTLQAAANAQLAPGQTTTFSIALLAQQLYGPIMVNCISSPTYQPISQQRKNQIVNFYTRLAGVGNPSLPQLIAHALALFEPNVLVTINVIDAASALV